LNQHADVNNAVDYCILTTNLSPNLMELMKFTSVCLKKLG